METETGGQYEAYYCVKRIKTRKQETKKQVRNKQETKMHLKRAKQQKT